ncbi:signal peptidase I [Micromonospora noduli]|uniref:Signal peptidase I n=1 Tax=Micromonospora noduli TaxID=709876 RepID=A0ABX9CZ42_9ACTN|nr:signal peptidase I [Micromonospora noduli]RAO13454.1 Signal peptidase I [Micromonospora noduli]RAO16248.1 Signal peptidase I [Micromonospora noduli]RAO32004.1 Signal peptidase I [Micromonospora noduli]
MRKLMVLLLLMAVAGCGDDDATETGATEQFTQGGVSMEPTVKARQVVTARTVTGMYEARRGDVVLIRSPGGLWGDRKVPLLKRVVAVGGETIACCDTAGKVTVDGRPLAEPYVAEDASLNEPPNADYCGPRRFAAVTVPADSVFLMGDSRARSNDSRCAGPLPVSSVFAVMVG